MKRIDVLNNEIKEMFGKEFKVYKTLTATQIVKTINEFGGINTILTFKSLKELETFLNNLKTLKYKNIAIN